MNIGYPNRVQFEDLSVGDVVVYAPFAGDERRVVITSLDEEIKNGRSGFGGYIVNLDNSPMANMHPSNFGKNNNINVWGYSSQILTHEKSV
jgi:hypothetical protein